jgi:hypothetical protein
MPGNRRGREDRKCEGSSEMIQVAHVLLLHTHNTFLHHLPSRLVPHSPSQTSKNLFRHYGKEAKMELSPSTHPASLVGDDEDQPACSVRTALQHPRTRGIRVRQQPGTLLHTLQNLIPCREFGLRSILLEKLYC